MEGLLGPPRLGLRPRLVGLVMDSSRPTASTRPITHPDTQPRVNPLIGPQGHKGQTERTRLAVATISSRSTEYNIGLRPEAEGRGQVLTDRGPRLEAEVRGLGTPRTSVPSDLGYPRSSDLGTLGPRVPSDLGYR